MALAREAYRALEDVVRPEYLTEEPAVLDGYCFVWGNDVIFGDNFAPRPHAVILPGSTEEVQGIVKVCNRYGIEFKAHSTGFVSAAFSSRTGFLSIDLRRMNKILEIDERNMYAVVEPYVSSCELITETIKRGLRSYNPAGPSTSIVASATSFCGLSSAQISAGFGGRTPLSVEWVLPDGEILRLGSLATGAGWFTGDGPGPSLRGVMRGYSGPAGGLGVITKAAIKLVPWYGPPQIETTGKPPSYRAEIPASFRVYTVVFPSRDQLFEALYLTSEEAISYACSRRGPFTMAAGMTASNKEVEEVWRGGYFQNKFAHSLSVVLDASSPREMEYREACLQEILRRTEGEIFPEDSRAQSARFVHAFTGQGGVKGTFRSTGAFITGANADEALKVLQKANELAYGLKDKFAKEGKILDDADSAWVTGYEDSAFGGHEELVVRYDPADPDSTRAAAEVMSLIDSLWLEKNIDIGAFAGCSHSSFEGSIHEIAGPKCLNYHIWMKKIKSAFDPNLVSESSFYVNPDVNNTSSANSQKSTQNDLDNKQPIA
ncbi:MAG: FAD-binding oxidoreductase [Thermodesulfobacteriota bacterium]|jgi:glycolate oxidase